MPFCRPACFWNSPFKVKGGLLAVVELQKSLHSSRCLKAAIVTVSCLCCTVVICGKVHSCEREHSYLENIDTHTHTLRSDTIGCCVQSRADWPGIISLYLRSLRVHAGRLALSCLPVGSCYVRIRLLCYCMCSSSVTRVMVTPVHGGETVNYWHFHRILSF